MNHIIYEMDGDGEYSLRGGTCKILTVLCCSRYWMLQTCDRFLENVLTFSKPQFKFPKAETSPRLLLTSVDLVLIPAHIRIYIYICDMRCGCLKIQEYNKNDNFLPFSKKYADQTLVWGVSCWTQDWYVDSEIHGMDQIEDTGNRNIWQL